MFISLNVPIMPYLPLGSKAGGALLEEAHRFLWLVARSHEALVPSEIVDSAVHEILADTEYLGSVEQQLGVRIIHDSGLCGEAMVRGYERTLGTYQDFFGEPNPAYWGLYPVEGGVVGEKRTSPSMCGVGSQTRPAMCGVGCLCGS